MEKMIFGMHSDQLIAITSLCAVIISTLSFVLTVITGFLQIKHNKNSIRPISDIRVQDYEDLIAVRIENVGIGPLVVRKLRFKREDDNIEYSCFAEKTFLECVLLIGFASEKTTSGNGLIYRITVKGGLMMKRNVRKDYRMLPIVLDGQDVQAILGVGHSYMSELFRRDDFPKLEILKRNLVLKDSFFSWLESREEDAK